MAAGNWTRRVFQELPLLKNNIERHYRYKMNERKSRTCAPGRYVFVRFMQEMVPAPHELTQWKILSTKKTHITLVFAEMKQKKSKQFQPTHFPRGEFFIWVYMVKKMTWWRHVADNPAAKICTEKFSNFFLWRMSLLSWDRRWSGITTFLIIGKLEINK